MGVTRDLARLNTIAMALARHGFGHHLARLRQFRGLSRNTELDPALVEADAAVRFAKMLEELGPTFVKLGQILSTRPDLLPPSFIAELCHLQDKVPPLAFDEIRNAIADGLPGSVEAHFSFISEQPLASASIAQVHAAKLLDGTPVVVKVQRPGIGAQMATDSDLIRKMARVFEMLFEEVGSYGPVAVVEEWQKGLALELDFDNEARAVHAFYEVNKGREGVRIPMLYAEHSSRTVLTLERLAGRRLADIVLPAERCTVATALIDCAFRQVFEDGLFHADPHPGNFLILDSGAIGILDFGLVGHITKDSQDSLIALALAIALGDADTVARLVYRIGNPEERIPLGAFRSEMRLLLDRYVGLRLEQVRTRVLARELLDLMARYKLRVPREFALLAKATVTLEGVTRELNPDLDVKSTLLPYTEQLLMERFDPRQMQGGGLKLMLQLAGFLQDLPLQLSQALLDMETGKTTIRVEGRGMESLASSVRSLGIAVLAAAVAAASIIGGVIAAPHVPGYILGWPTSVVGGITVATLVALPATLFVLAHGRLPRLRLRRGRSRLPPPGH
ncbi:MAG: AarF/UbiB family protein [Pseudomonadota bacterium]